jgi:hypothetical protein
MHIGPIEYQYITVHRYYLPLPVIMIYGSIRHRCKVSPYIKISYAIQRLTIYEYNHFFILAPNYMGVKGDWVPKW